MLACHAEPVQKTRAVCQRAVNPIDVPPLIVPLVGTIDTTFTLLSVFTRKTTQPSSLAPNAGSVNVFAPPVASIEMNFCISLDRTVESAIFAEAREKYYGRLALGMVSW